MTVYLSIATWLQRIIVENGLQGVHTIIDVELLPDFMRQNGWQDTALFSSPNDIHTQLCGRNMKHIETKTWLIKREFMDNQSRLATEEFMEKLRKAITMKALRSQMPDNNNGRRRWRKISVEGTHHVSHRDEDNATAVYTVTLRLEYIE